MPVNVSATSRESITEFVLEQVEAVGAVPEEMSLTATFDDLGLDSLDVVEISQRVKKELGIPVGPKDFAEAETLSDAVAVICHRAGIA